VPEFCESCGKSFPWTGKRDANRRAARGWGPAEHVLDGLLSRFHAFARQLRQRHDDRTTVDIEDEYDVQDVLRALLGIFFDDVRSEEWTPSYAGSSARMDFLLKTEQLVVEVKKTRKGLAAKEIGDQLLIDIGRYKAHQDCKKLVCFVYDPDGRIRNAHGLERDLTRSHDGLDVKVVVWPKT
jgi:hypothetical protein